MNSSDDQDRCSGVLMLAIAVVMMLWSLTLRLGTVTSPGPGMFPLILSGLLAILSSVVIVEQVKAGFSAKYVVQLVREQGLQVGIFCVLYFAYVLTFEAAGFILSTSAFLILVYVCVLQKGLIWAIASALIVTLPIYWVFDRLLSVALPSGVLG